MGAGAEEEEAVQHLLVWRVERVVLVLHLLLRLGFQPLEELLENLLGVLQPGVGCGGGRLQISQKRRQRRLWALLARNQVQNRIVSRKPGIADPPRGLELQKREKHR